MTKWLRATLLACVTAAAVYAFSAYEADSARADTPMTKLVWPVTLNGQAVRPYDPLPKPA
jgi:hypothetical protein